MVNNILKKLFENWNKNQVDYCILRNYDFLLKNKKYYEGKDIDILINKKSLKKAKSDLLKLGFLKLDLNFASNHEGYVFFDERIVSVHLHIDGVSGKNIDYLIGKKILERKIKTKFFYHTSNMDLFFVILMHLIFDKKKIEERYVLKLKNLVKFVKQEDFENLFSKKYTKLILGSIKKNNFDLILKNKNNLILNNYMRNFSNFFKIFKFYIFSFGYFLKRLFKKGKLIAIVGLDGTGKTTLNQNLNNYYNKSLFRVKNIYMGRGKNNILPINLISKLFIRKNENEISIDKQSSPTIGQEKKFNILFTIVSFLFFIDLYLRYVFRLFPAKIKNDYVITDRYITDMILMNGVPYFLRKLYFNLLPKPDIFLYLHNNIKILHKRKGHPLDDLNRQKKIYDKLSKKYEFMNIKSDSEEQTFNDTIRILIKNLK